MKKLLLLLLLLNPLPALSGGETIDTTTVFSESINTTCLDYEVVGVCVWLTCTPFGCSLDYSVKVKHYIPDAVVSVYQNTGENPWTDVAALSQSTPIAQDGGTNKETPNAETALLFKNADVIGSPGGLWIDQLSQTGYFCPTSTTPLMPYMLSTLDPMWRNPLFETPATLANWTRYVTKGGSTWGPIYPRHGFINQGHDYKAGATLAQRAGDIVTRENQLHAYIPMNGNSSPGYWPPGPIIEGDAKTHRWQQLIPKSQAGECRVFPDQSDQHAGGNDPFKDRLSQNTGYAFNLWRPYQCCEQRGAVLVADFGGEDAEERAQAFIEESEADRETPTETTSIESTGDRDNYWRSQGYELSWFATPDESDIGTSFDQYLRGPAWTNGQPIPFWFKRLVNTSIDRAPDGSPALKITLQGRPPGSRPLPGLNIKGDQFGPNGVDKKAVFSHEIYYPCASQNGNPIIQQYIGFGHHWGSSPGKWPMAAGSKRYEPNRTWTFRIPAYGKQGNPRYYAGYGYWPDHTKVSGTSYALHTAPQCGRWELIEAEIIQNKPASARNAVLKMFINGALKKTVSNFRTREYDDVRIRGFGMFLARGVPPKDATHFIRNQKIFFKDY